MAPWPRPGAPWAGPERLGGLLLRVILPLFTHTRSGCPSGARGIAWGGSLGQQELGWGLICSCLHRLAERPPPRSQETAFGFGVTMTYTVPLPILNTIPPPAPDLARDSPAAGRAWRLWGLLCEGQALPSPIPPCPRWEVLSPRLTAETWARAVPAMEEVGVLAPRQPSKGGVGLLAPLQLYHHPPCPAWGLLCHHHLASGTSHPLNQPHRSVGLELGDLGPERTPVCRCPCPQSRDPPDPSPPHPGVTSAGRLGVSPPTVGGSAPSAPLTPESDHLKERLPPGPASRKVA